MILFMPKGRQEQPGAASSRVGGS